MAFNQIFNCQSRCPMHHFIDLSPTFSLKYFMSGNFWIPARNQNKVRGGSRVNNLVNLATVSIWVLTVIYIHTHYKYIN